MKVLTGLTDPIYNLDEQPVRENERPVLDDSGRPQRGEDGSIVMEGTTITLKRALAVIISRQKTDDPVRMMEIAHRLQHSDNGTLEVDDVDVDALIAAAKADRGYTNLVLGPVIKMLQGAKEPLAPQVEPEPTEE